MTLAAAKPLAKTLASHDAGSRVALAAELGIDARLVHRAAAGRKVNAEAFLRLCAHASIDPMTGEAVAPRKLGAFSWNAFACALIMARLDAGKTLRAYAKSSAASYSTFSRAEGQQEISAEALIAICRRMKRHPFDFTHGFTGNTDCNKPARNKGKMAEARA